MRKTISLTLMLSLLCSTSACFNMEHNFDGTVYFNPLPDARKEGHLDKDKMVGYALYGLVPYDQEPTRSIVPSTGREIADTKIETQFTVVDGLVELAIAFLTFGIGNVIYESRTITVEGDYINPEDGPAPLNGVYQ